MSDLHDDVHDESEAHGPELTQNKADSQTPGEILREGRLAHDYSVNDLCAQTKLPSKTIRALEDDDFNALSQPVFARGYFRQCAKVLDLNVDRLLAAYSATAGAPPARPASPSLVHVVPQDVTPGGFGVRGLLLLVVIVVVVIAGVVVVMSGASLPSISGSAGNDDGNTTQVLSNDENANGRSDTGTGFANQNGDNGASTDLGAGGTPDVVGKTGAASTGQTSGGRNVNRTLGITPPNNGNDSNAAGAGASSTNPQDAAPSVPPNRLKLTFRKRSWVRVEDANGNRMASGIFESGKSKVFNGTPPYKVTLGYAPGVDVTIGGQTVDVAARTGGGAIAHLTISAAHSDDNG